MKNKHKRNPDDRGLTLVEIIVLTVLIGGLSIAALTSSSCGEHHLEGVHSEGVE